MLSRAVACLTDAGLVERQPDPRDKRAAIVEVTDAGTRLGEQIRAERAEALGVHLADLSDRELDALLEALPVLEKLADRLRDRRP
jgi:DNA-binding MarR family transcriptional regulator